MKAQKDIDASPRQIPFDVELEQALLGAFLVDNHWFDKVAGDLISYHFYDPLHGRMWEAMSALYGTGQAVTPFTLKSALGEDAGFGEVGGMTYLMSLARGCPPMPNVREYVKILADIEARRQVIHIGEELVNAAFDNGWQNPIAPIARIAAETLIDVAVGSDQKRPAAASDIAMRVIKNTEDALAGKPVPSVPSGIIKLQTHTGGFRGGDFVVLPGRPGMGKSALLAGIGIRAALSGYPTLVFSLEMKEEQWMERTLCDLDYDYGWETPIEYRKFRTNKITDNEFSRIVMAQQRLVGLPFEVVDDDTLTVEDIAARARAFKSKYAHLKKIGLIVIDYLQIIKPSAGERGRSREQEIAHIARGGKRMAKQLDWPVIAGAQLSREADKRPEKQRRPILSDIRESGAIEAEADVVIAPYRPGYYVEERRPGSDATDAEWGAWSAEYSNCRHDLELIGMKQRHGSRFAVHLHCDMGASAIRDSRPSVTQQEFDNGQELLPI